jgi:hypothetical protein
MAMGSDQMADLDSIQAPINERSPSSAAGDDLLCPDASAKFATQSDELSPCWTGTVDFRCSGGCVSRVLAVAVSLCDAPRRKPHSLLLGYSSLLAQCLRLVSYATGALSSLRLCPFHGGSSLPSLCYRIADNPVTGLLC